jgi:hypothetical protein
MYLHIAVRFYRSLPKEKELKISKLQIDVEAPIFVMNDFDGKKVELIRYRNKKYVLLVFNRGFH